MTTPQRFGQAAAIAIAMGLSLGLAGQAAALNIQPVFDSSITSAANASDIEHTITTALSFYNAALSNPVDLSIRFALSTSLGTQTLAQSSTMAWTSSFASYVGLLKSDLLSNPGNAVLQSALANMGTGNTASRIVATQANLKALGDLGQLAPELDGTITLNANAAIVFGSAPTGQQYSGLTVLAHEINEVLGAGGAGSQLGKAAGARVMGPMDLYRYAASGVGSFDVHASMAYFSVDGGRSNLIGFNQVAGSDYGDFGDDQGSCVNSVQTAVQCKGQVEGLGFGGPAFIALQAIGYNPSAVPEPEPLALLGVGAVALLLARKATTPSPRAKVVSA